MPAKKHPMSSLRKPESSRVPTTKTVHHVDSKRRQPRKRRRKSHHSSSAGMPSSSSSSMKVFTRTITVDALGLALPPLTITYTNDASSAEQWFTQQQEQLQAENQPFFLGLDTETKPTFTREAAMNCPGPDVLQLAVSSGHCLVLHISHMATDSQRNPLLFPPIQHILKDSQVIKAGVGIDRDALDLYEKRGIILQGRLDLTTIPSLPSELYGGGGSGLMNDNKKNSQEQEEAKEEQPTLGMDPATQRPNGLKGLTEYWVPNMIVPKKKKLQMSNWGICPLSDAQVGYAAADAFAAAKALEQVLRKQHSAVHAANTDAAPSIDSQQSTLQSWIKGNDVVIQHYRAHIKKERDARQAAKQRAKEMKKRESKKSNKIIEIEGEPRKKPRLKNKQKGP